MKKIITLDQAVINALEFFNKNKPPKLDLKKYKLPFVVGSGNAFNTGQILFSNQAAVLADESSFKKTIFAYTDLITAKKITQVVIISSSGEKDSVWEIKLAQKLGLKTTLLTCKPNSSAAKIAEEVIVFRSLDEPYTYNTSTYLGMMLSVSKESSKEILELVKKIKLPLDFNKYRAYAFILPDSLIHLCPMLDIKKDELFGPYLSLRSFTQGHARHAKFVHPTKQELVISVGTKNKYFGLEKQRWDTGLSESIGYPTAMAFTYFLVGKIQQAKPAYFIKNVKNFCEKAPLLYGGDKSFSVIVPGN